MSDRPDPGAATVTYGHTCPLLPRRRRVDVAFAAVLGGALLAGCGSAGTGGATSAVSHVSVSLAGCGRAWTAPRTGKAQIVVTNTASPPNIAEVYLANARTGALYNELEGLASGGTRTLAATLPSGEYRLQCYLDEDNPTLGPVVHVRSSAPRGSVTPAVLPVTFADLVPPTKAYQAWVTSELPVLLRQVEALAVAVRSGSPLAAKRAWLTAHLTYERLGAAYDAFGPLDDRINGFPPGSETWRTDRRLTGFHLVEGLLWSGAAAARVERAVAGLRHYVQLLIGHFATAEIQPYEMALRSHEIVENAIQFELTAETDEGSHTNLATIGANLWGARHTLSYIVPLLRSRYPQLGETERALTASERLVASYDHDGSWTPLQSLGTLARERLNASLENLVELLAPIAAICEIRYVPRGDGQ